ncbi:hypothetical protein PM082_002202 [Marasmius tenuissimus]|nr:hypothetical protein PM082_002202 [Marasmius tenuissimus]
MCRRRFVRNIYTQCGHALNLPEKIISCSSSRCKFSPEHPPDCYDCKKTCWQYHQFPEQYSPHIDGSCPDCKNTDALRRRI